jgi:hypothetical protein
LAGNIPILYEDAPLDQQHDMEVKNMRRLLTASLTFGILVCLGIGSSSAGDPPLTGVEVIQGGPVQANHKIRAFQKDEKCGCWSHHNEFTCGSLKSECTFLFGSCRSFFGEPCVKVPKGEHRGLFGCKGNCATP